MATATESLTTRNQVRGTVTSIVKGAVMAEVKVDVHGEEFVAAVTLHSVERLGLATGDEATVLVKATEVMLAKGSGDFEALTTRNRIAGRVSAVKPGAVMAEVTIDVHGEELVAVVTRSSVERLALSEGDEVVVLIKATEVMLAR